MIITSSFVERCNSFFDRRGRTKAYASEAIKEPKKNMEKNNVAFPNVGKNPFSYVRGEKANAVSSPTIAMLILFIPLVMALG